MHIRNRKALEKFAVQYPGSRKPLQRWADMTQRAKWLNLVEVKAYFPATDYVNGRHIFNIGGNNYRLVAYLDFTAQTVTVLSVHTHDEYSKLRF